MVDYKLYWGIKGNILTIIIYLNWSKMLLILFLHNNIIRMLIEDEIKKIYRMQEITRKKNIERSKIFI